jgi:predicted TIM-barrel fold metal-dependent hydrolase
MRSLPPGACDCHAHVFGPFERFPLAVERTYTPPLTEKASYLEMLDTAGFGRGVLVHGGASGWNQGAMIDALRSAPQRLRGIAVPPPDVGDSELADLHAAGVRGVRFTQIAGPSAARRYDGRLDLSDLKAFAPRLRQLGWHAQLWVNCAEIEANELQLRACEVPLVFDHLGHIDITRGVADSAFQTLLRLVAEGVAWVKLTVFRNSRGATGYADVRPFHDALIEANASRMIWGSDWPFLGMTGAARPSVESLLSLLDDWLPDPGLWEQILSRNPAVLYGF